MKDEDREADALADARRMCAVAERIAARGEEAFFDDDDPVVRLAAKALVIDLATALQAAPGWRSRHEETWTLLKKTRDRYAHFYVDFDFGILWGVVTERLPELRQSLGDGG